MSEQPDIHTQIGQTNALLREKLGVRGKSLSQAVSKARHRLPRRIYRQMQTLARAEPLSDHPKLQLTLDQAALGRASAEVKAYLEQIDIADRRKGWVLGVLGGLSFNLILAFALLIGFLVWQGII